MSDQTPNGEPKEAERSPGIRPAPRHQRKSAEKAVRQEKALALRVKGWSIRAIAIELGVSLGQAHRDIEDVLDRTRKDAYENAERHIAVSLERLDKAVEALASKVEAGDARAIDTIIRLEERRAKLLGLDAADRVEISGPSGAPIAVDARSDLIERLSRLVAGAAPGVDPAGGAGPTQPG